MNGGRMMYNVFKDVVATECGSIENPTTIILDQPLFENLIAPIILWESGIVKGNLCFKCNGKMKNHWFPLQDSG
jgi:hypothetical protein